MLGPIKHPWRQGSMVCEWCKLRYLDTQIPALKRHRRQREQGRKKEDEESYHSLYVNRLFRGSSEATIELN